MSRRSVPRPRVRPVLAGSAVALAVVAALVVMVVNSGRDGPVNAQTPLPGTSTSLQSPQRSAPPSTPASTAPPAEPLVLTPNGGNVVTGPSYWWSWALVDRRTGESWGGPTADEPNRSVSMSKFWLAAVYLRTHPEPDQNTLNLLSTMIRDSNNDAADTIFFALGGREPMISTMASACGVTGPYIPPGYWWASTWISSRDAARLGVCLAEGRVANAQWTDWILNEMRQVRGGGNFGIRFAFPEPQRSTIAIKNGWNVWDQNGVWYINCVAIGDTWVLAVETRSSSGGETCRSVAEQLLQQPVDPLDIWSAGAAP
ncbi:MAG TPA: hypothetical protein VKB69_03305 [Micromonosporaceae bacterium]|nr:hypothetical protein [Micromonosporaceae bacterium]